ncbi:tetrahydrofolate dehydrogenase/cyclohydrolase catalytic domain-containing protein [Halostagnicola sp. A-GB9-2]|uniref:bifunctional 5,10-methylenetetrahydrofolate dehydrogenase/5,10-methenyltetrahydrofolate cyclohydrolase n=1 Tax=Halostagnicola sp. A-GB9-2 TaxID=3048066 RepID=UPI0024BF1212|nr:tetrahydrofolate dehydrogenase/cyclohydrolase catalytic domain-containing protein [Halostagnicola sp. A-GB9-2]MDJ1434675.1 tetrahydrofolate dehydrogenase/cyclohydrolase catalytic domain-containing protein [Halostagnicola sp. A-GB9-2]
MSTELLLGEPVAADIREAVSDRVHELGDRGIIPTLGTVLMSEEPADKRFMDLKHAACDDVGVATRDIRLDPSEPSRRLHREIEDLCTDSEIDGVFVQVPLPNHVALPAVRQRLEPEKDVDCFHPENLGRLVAGEPRFVPATPAAVCRLLSSYDVPVAGADVAIVGRSGIIGKPLANLLLQDRTPGNATVTVCHSKTADLASVTRQADVVVTASGAPELVDGSMLSSGAVVVDVSANREPETGKTDDGSSSRHGSGTANVVGDVEFESAREKASAITPVPGGVGPITLAMLVKNVVRAAERRGTDG